MHCRIAFLRAAVARFAEDPVALDACAVVRRPVERDGDAMDAGFCGRDRRSGRYGRQPRVHCSGCRRRQPDTQRHEPAAHRQPPRPLPSRPPQAITLPSTTPATTSVDARCGSCQPLVGEAAVAGQQDHLAGIERTFVRLTACEDHRPALDVGRSGGADRVDDLHLCERQPGDATTGGFVERDGVARPC